MAILYCYCDESGKKGDHPVVTFSALCLSQVKLTTFQDAWQTLLRQYQIESLHMAIASRLSKKLGPKMLRGQTPDQRTDALIPFADCINEHFELGLIQAMDIEGFNALSKNARYKLGSPDDPYFIAFMRGGLEVIKYAKGEDKVSIVCDDDRGTAWDCYRHYRGICHARKDFNDKVVSLTFADDRYFPALQAADMLAFLTRLEVKRLFYGDHYSFKRLFDYTTKERGAGHAIWRYCPIDKEKFKSLSVALEKSRRR